MFNFLGDCKTVAVTCLQWGDTGKGKIVDLLAEWADIICRGTGGANAGHSVHFGGIPYVFHLIPSGILYDREGKTNIIGSGTAVDPKLLCEELALLAEQGLPFDHLQIAMNAKLTLPTHVLRDRLSEGEHSPERIGTTGRGIGPTYGDHVLRVGLVVNDLLNPDILAAKVARNVEYAMRILKSYNPEAVRTVLHQPFFGRGMFYDPKALLNVDAIVEQYLVYGRMLAPMIKDTDSFLRWRVGKDAILLEGAQGTLLDVDYGTRPFVTSSNCTVDGLAKGAGLNRSHVDLSLGVFKGFYQTRVGAGPFPTELGGKQSAQWCQRSNRELEKAEYGDITVNDKDEFRQGIALRIVGNEYGATTGRPRRIGWLDLPLLRYAMQFSGKHVVLTKLDVLDECETINICTHYKYAGPAYQFGGISTGESADTLYNMASPTAEFLEHCQPVYRSFPGWKQSLKGISVYGDLPDQLREIIDFLARETFMVPRIVSTGPDRTQTIFV